MKFSTSLAEPNEMSRKRPNSASPFLPHPNNPYEFKVRRKSEKTGKTQWCPMQKGISYLYAYAEKGLAANCRYLDALAGVEDPKKTLDQFDEICEKKRSMVDQFQHLIR